ncbi:MAG: hypothetical protein AB8G15_16235, partial [Saprospiraceae bacterium]
NNMQENTMGIFTLAAVYFAIQSLHQNRGIPAVILAGVFIFLASFSKGIPGFFPLATLGIYGLVFREVSFRKIIGYSLILIAVPVVIYAALLLHDSARESLDLYLNARVLKRIGSAPTVDSRFYILGKLFMELLPAMLLTGLLWLLFYFKKMPKIGNPNYKMALVYALIGLSAAAPMMLTLVQKGFYIVPCFPFFGISFALLIAPYLAHWTAQLQIQSVGFKWSKRGAWILLLASMIFAATQVGKASRDEAMLHDVYLMGEVIPAHSAISVSKSLATDWSVHMYFMRHFYISLDKNVGRDFFLQEKTSQKIAPSGFKLVNLASQKYDLFVRE